MNFFGKKEPHQIKLARLQIAQANTSPEVEALRLELVKVFKSGSGMRAVAELVLEREAKMEARIAELESVLRDAHVRLQATMVQ